MNINNLKTEQIDKNDPTLIVDSTFIQPGIHYARLQYIVMYNDDKKVYYQAFFETNSIRLSNGKRYTIKNNFFSDELKSIFFYEEVKLITDILNKVYKIEVIKEKGYPKVVNAELFDSYDESIHTSIPTEKQIFNYYEMNKYKSGGILFLPNKTKISIDKFLEILEQEEIDKKNNDRNNI